MGRVALILTSLLYSIFCFGQEWNATQLNDRVKIDFPAKPEFEYSGIVKTYFVLDTDYVITVSVNPLMPGVKFDPNVDDLAGFYESFFRGALAAATNSKLLTEREIEIADKEAREMIYTKDFNGLTGIKITKRVLLLDRVLFSFEVWDLTGRGQKKLTKRFFESIKVS